MATTTTTIRIPSNNNYYTNANLGENDHQQQQVVVDESQVRNQVQQQVDYNQQYSTTNANTNTTNSFSIPNEIELLLLCLDHMRTVRRSSYYPSNVLDTIIGIDSNYLTLACWALNKSIETVTSDTTNDNSDNNSNTDTIIHQEDLSLLINTTGNDPWFDKSKSNSRNTNTTTTYVTVPGLKEPIPDLQTMENEFLYSNIYIQSIIEQQSQQQSQNTQSLLLSSKETKQQDFTDTDDTTNINTILQNNVYNYNDYHTSNKYRYYTINGLGSTCLNLGEIITSGLYGLHSKTRSDAEYDMISTTLFSQFLEAVQSKGFFDVTTNTTSGSGSGVAVDTNIDADPTMTTTVDGSGNNVDKQKQQQIYDERYRKVVTKFRTKLAIKADTLATTTTTSTAIGMGNSSSTTSPTSTLVTIPFGSSSTNNGDYMSFVAAAEHNKHRSQTIQQAIASYYNTTTGSTTAPATTTPPVRTLVNDKNNSNNKIPNTRVIVTTLSSEPSTTTGNNSNNNNNIGNKSIIQQQQQYHINDLEESEKLKNYGNTCMQNKEYKNAIEYYTQALKLVPNSPNAHVYYSNRAAALVSMKKFHEAIIDSERSLQLKPDYGKAHARLGLAHFLLGNYRQAVEAYTVALKYEPSNTSSKNYLEKAAKRLAEIGDIPNKTSLTTSYSIVSEWDIANNQHNHQQQILTPKIPPTSTNTMSIPTTPSRQGTSTGTLSATADAPPSVTNNNTIPPPTPPTPAAAVQMSSNERDAEKYKSRGNTLMSNRDYNKAYDAYSKAIELCNNGIQSHVYYSNRAAALCYLERYTEAEYDSLQSLQLYPTYGKAHARLGLSRFFLQDYTGAINAYTCALQYDPDNAASKSYLSKAISRLKEQQQNQQIQQQQQQQQGTTLKE